MTAGNIPTEFSQLSSLTRLCLDNNKLSGNDIFDVSAAFNGDDMNAGNIPMELSQLSSLQRLHLNKNNLSGKGFLTAS
jgi:Leucine-rich repeat (LRR) protein